jgi:phage tail sheath gpL-like
MDSNAARLNVRILKSGTQTSMLAPTLQRMAAGRSYTFVVYGYADSVGTKAIRSKLFENPF